MPPRSSKKAIAKSSKGTGARTPALTKRQLEKQREKQEVKEWIEKNDPLIDVASDAPIILDTLLTSKLIHKTFAQPGSGETPYDWSAFRAELEKRDANSPRWFVQLREEDLLLGPDGLDGVTVDCFVIVECSEPTLAPAQYVVKTHWPYSDLEDNAPERILQIAEQNMCWRRVVKNDGSDMNVFMLQKRSDPSGSSSTPSATSAASFGFGAASAASLPPAATAVAAPPATFSFGAAPPTASPQPPSSGIQFGFGAAAATANAPAPSFGFGFAAAATTATTDAPPQLSFGATAVAVPLAPASTAAPASGFSFGSASIGKTEGGIDVKPLKTSEICFSLWSKKRLTEITKEVKSGSRIVREDFPLDSVTKMKLVMQNDRTDGVKETVRRLILNRLFAKRDEDVQKMDEWIGNCPVYDEHLTPALQEFRERHLDEIAEESDLFEELYERYHTTMETELERIVKIRQESVNLELDAVAAILEQIREHKLAEKGVYRLLKYYPSNSVQKFRPFGKISGISEMGEMVDVCVPPAHVNINPFTGKAA